MSLEQRPSPRSDNRLAQAGRWTIILLLTSVVFLIVGYIITQRMQKVYEAKASIFVQPDRSGLRIPGELASLSLFTQGTDPSSYAVALLESDDLAREIILEFNLLENPDFNGGEETSMQAALKAIRRNLRVEDDRRGLITLAMRTRSPQLSADVANTFIDSFLIRVADQNMRKSSYIGDKIEDLEQELETLEENLKDLSTREEVVNLPEQTRAAVQQIASIQQQVQNINTEMNAVESDLQNTGDLQKLAELRAKRESLLASRQELESAEQAMRQEMRTVPQVALRQARLQREIDHKANLFKILAQQHELAQIDQESESRVYQVLDRAYPPDKHIRPSLALNLSAALFVGITIGVAINILITEIQQAKS